MEIILLEDISSLGKAGEIIKVRNGYGRNYLLPQKKAVLADSKNLKAVELQKKRIEKQRILQRQKAEELATRLTSLEVTVARAVGAQDRLFGSVTKTDIAEALRQQGVHIDRHLIELEAPLKEIGTYDVAIRLHPEIPSSLKVWVVRKEAS